MNRSCFAPPTSACCARRLWIPQGLWALGIGVFLLLIVLLFVESLLLVLAGRGREAEALLHARTYQEEAAEALEAVGAPDSRPRKDARMIAILFLLVLVGLTIVLSLMGAGPGNVLIGESLLLVGAVLRVLRRRHLCRRPRSACSG